MLARVRAFVGAHEFESLLGNRPHRLDVLLEPQVQHRPYVQAADRCVRVPGAARAVLLEDVGEPAGIFRQAIERHRAIFDERDRLSLLFHRHHDIEAGGAHLVDGGLQLGIEHLDHATPFRSRLVPAEAKVAHELMQPQQTAEALAIILLRELDEQDGFGIAVHDRVGRGLKHRDLARQCEHGAVHELDRNRAELHDVLGRIHRLREIAEMAGADCAAAEQRRKLQLDPRGESQSAFRADEDMREIEIVAAGNERIEIVAADPAL